MCRTLTCLIFGVALLATPSFAGTHYQVSPSDLIIPDDGPEVSATMAVALDRYITEISVFIELVTPQTNHMDIAVTSAWGTRVLLMHQAAGGEPNGQVTGWYPENYTSFEDMSQWLDEGGGGIWTIHCQDVVAGGGGSTLVSWGVQITYDDATGNAAATWSGVKALFE